MSAAIGTSTAGGMRLWYQSSTQIGTLRNYAEALAAHAAKVCSPGVTVRCNGVTEARYHGRMPAEILRYGYAKLVLQREIIGFCRGAERDGHDAVILGSFSEPFLPEIRSLLDIPVVSMPEAALLVACSLAEQVALITLAPSNVRRLKALVRRHGLEGRICGYHALADHLDEADLDRALLDPDKVVADFRAVADAAAAAGADAIIPAEGILNLIVYNNGVHRAGGATIVDCVGVAMLYAEMAVNMKRRLGIGVGRRWTYATPGPDLLRELDAEA